MALIAVEKRMSRSKLQRPEPYDMFTDRDLYRVEFRTMLTMYKLTHANAVVNGAIQPASGGNMTPWWFSYNQVAVEGPVPIMVTGIPDALRKAQQAGATLPDFQRSRGAVNIAWKNPMSHLLVVKLRRPVVGLLGRASHQQHDGINSNVYFIGGAIQFYLPGLTSRDLEMVSFGGV